MDITIPAGEFKAQCLAILDEVKETKVEVIVTKRGVPVAKVVPIRPPARDLKGSITLLVDDPEAIFSTGESWDAQT